MRCQNCGKEIAKDSLFCEYCGAQVKSSNNGEKKKVKWWGVILGIICVFVGIWGIPFVSQGSNSADYIDLGLSSGTKWKKSQEPTYYTYDEAMQKYGKKMPTFQQITELREQCSWTWLTNSWGYEVKGPNGNSIFIYAAGLLDENGWIKDSREIGYYWSQDKYDNQNSWILQFTSNDTFMNINGRTIYKLSVLLVSADK